MYMYMFLVPSASWGALQGDPGGARRLLQLLDHLSFLALAFAPTFVALTVPPKACSSRAMGGHWAEHLPFLAFGGLSGGWRCEESRLLHLRRARNGENDSCRLEIKTFLDLRLIHGFSACTEWGFQGR